MLLELQNLGKSFGEHEVLKDVNAGVERGDRIGIIGANGTGKTTLLRILCGESLPDAGDAAFGTGVTCGYLEQNARLAPTLDIYATMKLAFAPALDAMQKMDDLQRRLAADPHNTALTEEIAHCTAIVDAMDAYNMDTQIKKVLNGMGFPVDTWVKLAGVLSGGEQTRLRLARLLLERPDLLILDEPTNHLDLETMEWLENYLKTYRGAVLVVSHDRYFLDAVCTRIWELRGKTIKTYRGNYSAYLPQREAADERQQKLHDAAVEKAAKLQDYVDRNLVRASTTKMAQSRRKQLEKLEIVEAPTAEAYELNVNKKIRALSTGYKSIFKLIIAVNVAAGLTGSSSGGLSIALENMQDYFLGLGLSPNVIHRIGAMSSGGLDSMPHVSGFVNNLQVCRLNRRQSYPSYAMVCLVIPIVTTCACAVLLQLGILPAV